MTTRLLACLLCLVPALASGAGLPYRVADIGPDTPLLTHGGQAGPSEWQRVADGVVFSNADAEGQKSLWVTDGSAAGTKELLGTYGTVVGGTGTIAFYITFDAVWRTDGTPAGTFPVFYGEVVDSHIAGERILFHRCQSQQFWCELWAAADTAESAHAILEVGEKVEIAWPTAHGESAFIARERNGVALDLWTTDGTPEGTAHVVSLGGAQILGAISLPGGRELFALYGTGGEKLWVSDGTAGGTRILQTRTEPIGGFDLATASVIDGVAYFSISSSTNLEIWRSDGSAVGTARILSYPYTSSPSLRDGWVAKLGPRLLFVLPGTIGVDYHLWSSLGTPASSAEVSCTVCSHLGQSGGSPWLRTVGGRVVFAASADGGLKLWTVDATATVTRLADLCSGFCEAGPAARLGSYLYFGTSNGSLSTTLWKTNGSSAARVDIFGADFGESFFAYPERNVLLFAASKSALRAPMLEVWATGGSAATTVPLTEVGTTG